MKLGIHESQQEFIRQQNRLAETILWAISHSWNFAAHCP
jgi:hypothetical protein